jgi:hypothetical protein
LPRHRWDRYNVDFAANAPEIMSAAFSIRTCASP